MEPRALAFVVVMAVIVAIAIIVWLIYMIARRRSRTTNLATTAPAVGTRWFEFLLAAILLLGLILLGAWLLIAGFNITPEAGDGGVVNWRATGKTTAFITVVAVVVGISILAFIIYALTHIPATTAPAQAEPADVGAANKTYETPAATRLLGLLLFILLVLLLGWLYLPYEQQYQLLLHLLYPASLGVALVLLFDKATRRWSPKGRWASAREWLYCDGIVFLLVLGFINLLNLSDAQAYRAFFWDVLHIGLFFLIFWLLDRKLTRIRFLLAQGYLVILPLLLLIWRRVQEYSEPEGLSWWLTIWPFVCLALVAMVLEIITLMVSSDTDNRPIPALKDVIFLVLYAVLLINAIPEAVEATQ